jgi:excisionase family DNA binding protein
MNQLTLRPLETIETRVPAEQTAAGRLVTLPSRAGQSPRTAIGAPGFLSVRAAADRLELRPRSVRYLIEQGKLGSQRLGRMHFVPNSEVEAYRRVRRARSRRRQG